MRFWRCCGTGIGTTAHAGFIGKQAPLDALCHGLINRVAGSTTGRRVQAKGAFKYQRDDGRYVTEAADHNPKGNKQIGQGHKRDDQLSKTHYGADAAKDDEGGYTGNDQANHHGF